MGRLEGKIVLDNIITPLQLSQVEHRYKIFRNKGIQLRKSGVRP